MADISIWWAWLATWNRDIGSLVQRLLGGCHLHLDVFVGDRFAWLHLRSQLLSVALDLHAGGGLKLGRVLTEIGQLLTEARLGAVGSPRP